MAGNGTYPSPAIRRFAGALEEDCPWSFQIFSTMKDTLMGRAIKGAVINQVSLLYRGLLQPGGWRRGKV